jgi:hypothetical protein
MFAVVPARTVSLVAPSIRTLSVSPASKSRINFVVRVVGVVTTVWRWLQYGSPFFRS